MVMDLFMAAPEPPTELGRYRVLSKTAGIRVSPLQLGAMSVGDAWSSMMGSMSKEDSFKLLDAFVEAGGNFIDTSNNYQDEQSETWLGEWMKERNNRDLMVIATKYTTAYKTYSQGKGKTVNYAGNHKRSLKMSVRDSLKKLQTDWIDLLIEEVMDSLHELVLQGKVLYLGISDTPAYIVAAANTLTGCPGWNVMLRDMEREIIPMCRHFGMAIAPWDSISKKAIEERKKNNEPLRSLLGPAEQTEQEVRMSTALEEVAQQHGITSVTAVALAYVMSKAPYVFPLVGGRKVEHLKDNIQSLKIKLTSEQVEKLEAVTGFVPGFPNDFIGEDSAVTGDAGMLVSGTAQLSIVQGSKPIVLVRKAIIPEIGLANDQIKIASTDTL
nr:putative aryl-alcohol dehydrogenase aad14 [Quercus suber]